MTKSALKTPSVIHTVAPAAPGDKAGQHAPTPLMAAIDELGIVLAEKATLTEREKELKEVVIDAGLGGHDGELFHANAFESERSSTDDVFKAKVAELIQKHTSPQWRAAHMFTSVSTTVKVTARSAALVAAGKTKKG